MRSSSGSTRPRARSARATSPPPSPSAPSGATTVGGTLAVCRGGRDPLHGDGRPGRSPSWLADAAGRLGRPRCSSRGRNALVVSSGVKSLLDVPATAELLESLAVPLIGWRTDTLPLFYAADGGPPVSARVESAGEAAALAAAHWELLGGGMLLGRPPDDPLDDVEPLIERALAEAEVSGVRGQAVTPFVLSFLHRESGGRTLTANRDLIVANARLAGEIAAGARRGAPLSAASGGDALDCPAAVP